VENLPVPFDRRVWAEATTLAEAGYAVSVICPTGKGHEAVYERLEGVEIHRHPLPIEGKGALGYLLEYGSALWHQLRLTLKVARRQGIDVLHGCNPPDLIFLVAWASGPSACATSSTITMSARSSTRPSSAARRALAAHGALGAADLPHRHRLDRHERILRRDRAGPRRHGGGGRLRRALRSQARQARAPPATAGAEARGGTSSAMSA
jgi:hypothetical protein